MNKKYKHSIQYPKPLKKEDLQYLIDVALSGKFSRYSSSFVDNLEKELANFMVPVEKFLTVWIQCLFCQLRILHISLKYF